MSPLFGNTNERDNAFLPTARFDNEKTIRTIVVRYWKDAHPSGDSDIIYKTTDRIAAIEFYDMDGDVVAEIKSDRTDQLDQVKEIERKIPYGHELAGIRCCHTSEGI